MQERRDQDYLVERLKSDYTVPSGEEHLYHVIVEVEHFNNRTGARESRPRVQKFGAKTFDTFVRSNLTKQGYTLNILHDPHTWQEQRAAEARERQAQQAAEAAQMAEQAKAEERARLKAELLDEIKAELVAQPSESEQSTAEEQKRTRKPRNESEEAKAE